MITAIQDCVLVNQKNIFYKHFMYSEECRDTIVLLHDSLGCVTLWRDWPELLVEKLQCNILVYDRVGYGLSDRMDTTVRGKNYLTQEAVFLKAFLEILGLERVALFGHSDGASIALLYAALYPQYTSALIAEAGHIFVEEITLEGVRSAKLAYETTDLADRLVKYHGTKVDDIVKAWVDTWLSPEYKDWSVEDKMSNITSPLLFIQGDLDEYGSLDQVEKTIAKAQGPVEKVIFSDIGHTPHKECKEQTLDVVVSFFKRYL
ncbi:alpha/beta hydrolase [Myroides albus]|uniref:Alpha/beta fold hydrolase n=1 Tax=Myroides albus TaxID=2562892 RepID=A0A6I3LEU1_9FLAO|nr:alpha/beta hydrolase [Myroides albus]MTG97979.1 alpha/beta fold hydrolase [Myroides albus]UVD80270.1 alpha/beta hydrolase [Myroides albus]